MTNTVRILIDGEPRSVEPGTYTIAHLGLKDTAELTREVVPIHPLVIGGNDSFEIRGGESFITTLKHGEVRPPAVAEPVSQPAPAVVADPFTGDAVATAPSGNRRTMSGRR